MDLHTQTIYSLRLYNLKVELKTLEKEYSDKHVDGKMKEVKEEIDRLSKLLEL